ncbi:WD domain G-beta repeat uncharacterized protein [Prosthecobacter fusiformis]|uniref:WD domain G-beta repeat uncharacterized protein n=1 Tax=Prosthecobacter fusiformis TaxID=48464 RepID=A0A4R7RKC6_9BACT|nr:c-type cytochrome domain-containing protein [Prosthecobacter fusiformis]TDU64529.1 WD domain G-beta repeat uncharacterized protein [Prosthecobacter fusiformis]
MRRCLSIFILFPTLCCQADTLTAMRVLRDECLGCHKPGKAKGGLLLTTREKMVLGGDNGTAIIAGQPEDSLLYQLVLEDADPHMPPKKQISKTQVEALQGWIREGAPWDAKVFDELPTATPVALSPLPSAYQPVLALAISPDEKRLASSAGSKVHLYDLTKPGRPQIGSLIGHDEAVQSLAWSPDGKTVITGGFRQIRFWDAETQQESGKITDTFVGNITALALTPDGSTLFAADGETVGAGFIHRIDLGTRKPLTSWKAHDDTVYSLKMSPDGKSLASTAADKLARVWSVTTGSLTSTYEGHTNHVLSVAFNKDATQMATAGADREIKVWDVKSREQDVTLGDKKTAFTALAWTQNGKALVAVTEKGGGSIFTDLKKHDGAQRSETAKQTKLAGTGTMLYSVALTDDAKLIFAGADDGKVWIWDGSGKQSGHLPP